LKNAVGVIEVTSRKLVQTQRTYALGFPFVQVKKESWDSLAQSVEINIKNKLEEAYQTQNVIGFIEGEIDSFFVFGAHYDHLGRVGKDVYFPGANDNASGVATVLSLAKYYHDNKIKPKYSIAFMLFSAEEAGLIGSLYYTKNPLFPLSKIKVMFNLDMVGTGVEGLSVVNGKENPKVSELLQELSDKNNFFDDIRIGKGSANSDHHFFNTSGVPSVFLFTRGGPQYYHDILDRSETLELNKLDELIKMLSLFIASPKSTIDFRANNTENTSNTK
jgi:Zn-dependent M28 family amino/carboxypeptidase